ncbi:MAG: hypothetical protein LBD52_07225 [Prevotellaceae bacterium]|jgi:hypothetical protein|nr:hypothetical protein [Prevotellaceae bacterium]
MMKNSLLINAVLFCLCLLLYAACVATHSASTTGNSQFLDKGETSRYQLLIKANQSEITGIMLLKYMAGEWRGSLINEFGVKVFDLTATGGKCRLQHILPLLDKWHIRRTIASDFAFLLWNAGQGTPGKGKSIEQLPDGAFLLKNEKRHITYLFQPVK